MCFSVWCECVVRLPWPIFEVTLQHRQSNSVICFATKLRKCWCHLERETNAEAQEIIKFGHPDDNWRTANERESKHHTPNGINFINFCSVLCALCMCWSDFLGGSALGCLSSLSATKFKVAHPASHPSIYLCTRQMTAELRRMLQVN